MSMYSYESSPGEGWRVQYTDEDSGEVVDSRVVFWETMSYDGQVPKVYAIVVQNPGHVGSLCDNEMETAVFYHPDDSASDRMS